MHNTLLLPTEPDADLDSLVLVCDSIGCWDGTGTTTAIAVPDHMGFLLPDEPYDVSVPRNASCVA
jgi:hypothetical protein